MKPISAGSPFDRIWGILKKYDAFFLLLLLSAAAYLPNITQFGYFRDDWYMMYAANESGANVFHALFSIDRPMRGHLFYWEYIIFGPNPIYYNLSGFVFRVLSSVCFYWTLRMIWPRQKNAALVAALLFAIYPGFVSTPNAIDYQPHQAALFSAHLSIALSIWVTTKEVRLPFKIGIWVLCGLMTFFYIELVEHFAGLEVLRLCGIFIVTQRQANAGFLQSVKHGILNFLPFSAGTIAFVVWRSFFFDTSRKATDLASQASGIFQNPLVTLYIWTINLSKDLYEVLFLSWFVPFSLLWDTPQGLREYLIGGSIGIISFAVAGFVFYKRFSETRFDTGTKKFITEVFLWGFLTAIAGLIPIVLSNRDADFGNRSRYMIAAATGAVIIVAAILEQFKSRTVYVLLTGFLISSATMTHYFNGLNWMRSSAGMREFWWQVSWRIPNLKPGTALVANYSHGAVEEDYSVWGPANFIYYPHGIDDREMQPPIWAVVLNDSTASQILKKEPPEKINRRSIITFSGYDNILILTQPTLDSCVQVIDGNSPFLSAEEQGDIQQIKNNSDTGNIILDATNAPPPASVFGKEPEHTWCYYYESASLALQRGEFQTVLDLKREAQKEGFEPKDPIEWAPFIQAAAILNHHDEIKEMARPIKKIHSLEVQVCENLTRLDLRDDTKKLIEKTFCVSE